MIKTRVPRVDSSCVFCASSESSGRVNAAVFPVPRLRQPYEILTLKDSRNSFLPESGWPCCNQHHQSHLKYVYGDLVHEMTYPLPRGESVNFKNYFVLQAHE